MFIDIATEEIGRDNLPAVLEKADLATELIDFKNIKSMDPSAAAEAYALLQRALRVYYGRGARGILLRIGHKMWVRVIANAGITDKLQLRIIRSMPISVRRKAALDYAVKLLASSGGDVSAHTLDMDLYVQDKNSATTLQQSDNMPICFVTLGFLQEVLYWATGREHDVEEVSCRASKGNHCEFRIKASDSS